MDYLSPLLFLALGLACLVAEPAIPSFGILTVLGLTFGGIGIWNAFSVDTAFGWGTLAGGIIGVPLSYWAGFILLKHSPLTLRDSVGEPEPGPECEESEIAVGTRGKTISALRPSGTARFGDKRVEVRSTTDVVPPETEIEVAEVDGKRITVRLASPEQKNAKSRGQERE